MHLYLYLYPVSTTIHLTIERTRRNSFRALGEAYRLLNPGECRVAAIPGNTRQVARCRSRACLWAFLVCGFVGVGGSGRWEVGSGKGERGTLGYGIFRSGELEE